MRIFSPDRVQMMIFGVASSAPRPPLFRARHPDEYVAHQNRIPRRQEAGKLFFSPSGVLAMMRGNNSQLTAIAAFTLLRFLLSPRSDQIFK
jgi:hypothetical protein